jgi:hypothetical protein
MVPPFRHPPAHRFLHIDIDTWCDMRGVQAGGAWNIQSPK